MKKIFFAMACFIGLMFFASCTQEQINEIMEQKPVVSFVAEEGFISNNTSVFVGEEMNFKFKVAPNSGSQSELVSLTFNVATINATDFLNENIEITEPTVESVFTRTVAPTDANTYVVTVTVKDAAGKMNAAVVTVDYVQPIAAEIGVFEGVMVIAGHVTTDSISNQHIDQDLDTLFLPTTITLGTLEENNRVAATFVIDGTPVTLYSTMEDNHITFDQFNFNRTVNVFVDFVLNIVMNTEADIVDDTMTLTGNVTGTGTPTLLFVQLHANMTGTVEGTFAKTAK